jgi:single-stranded DNA-binding protein
LGRDRRVCRDAHRGAHAQIEGDIRTREYSERVGKGRKPAEVKRTITEARVASILKLDRPVRTGGATRR